MIFAYFHMEMICLDKLPAENWCKARKRKYKRTHVPFHESSLYTKEQVGSAEIVPSAFAAVLDVRVNIYSMAFIVVLISTDKVFCFFFPPHRDAPLSANNTQWQQRKQRILHIPGLLLLDQLQNRERDRERNVSETKSFCRPCGRTRRPRTVPLSPIAPPVTQPPYTAFFQSVTPLCCKDNRTANNSF